MPLNDGLIALDSSQSEVHMIEVSLVSAVYEHTESVKNYADQTTPWLDILFRDEEIKNQKNFLVC